MAPGLTRMRAARPLRLCLLVLALCAADAPADTVYFKDGMRTVCSGKAWQQGEEVHCEYEGGVLVYPLADVLRIEKSPGAPPPVADAAEEPDAPPPSAATPPPPPSAAAPAPAVPLSPGTKFYDPRRAEKYWSAPERRHRTLAEAVAALAQEFGLPPEEVEARIGDSNDLAEIRNRMAARPERPKAPAAPAAASENPSGLKFYDPRRPLKYATGPGRGHSTYAEAVASLAAEFHASPDWVEALLGESNDVGVIRERLRDAKRQSPAEPSAAPPPRPLSR